MLQFNMLTQDYFNVSIFCTVPVLFLFMFWFCGGLVLGLSMGLGLVLTKAVVVTGRRGGRGGSGSAPVDSKGFTQTLSESHQVQTCPVPEP